MNLLIKGGRVVNPALHMDEQADILITDGKITALSPMINVNDIPVYDARGLVIVPGLIDMHVHLREPGLEAKEDILSGTMAAAAGGFTTIACMPNTSPVVDNAILVAGILHRAQREGLVNVKVIGALSKNQAGKELAEIGDMLASGAVAISDDGHYVASAKLMRTALEYANMFGKPVISHAEDETLAGDGFMHEGAVSAMLGLRGRPAVAEDIAVAREIMLAEYTGAHVHIAHVSTAGAVELIRQAKKRGTKVTAEVTPHHLSLTDEAVTTFNPATKVCPPLRSQEHVDALIAGLKDGTIDAIACDHAPHAFEEKDREFRYAPNGFAGLETSLALILTRLYHTGKFSLKEIVTAMSVNPARILGLDSGIIAPGKTADLTLIDLNREWTVDSAAFYTKGKQTPFEGANLKGKAIATIVNGQVVMDKGAVKA